MATLTLDEQVQLLTSDAAEVVTVPDLKAKLERSRCEGIPLTVKLGCDPTAPDIHLGHAVVLRKLRQFQELGHEIVFIIGNFTGLIGDPSGRTVTRPQLSDEEIAANAETYRRQVGRILDESKTRIVFNRDWLAPLTLSDVVKLASTTTVARMLERDEFSNRYRDGISISVHEFIYPLAQAYDSVFTATDVELGGTDQLFNLVMTRDVQRAYGQEPQVALLMPLLEGLDGKEKMSKSLGNYIAVEDPPGDMFGKVMSLPDELMERYFQLCTDVPAAERKSIMADVAAHRVNPRDVKARLGREIVSTYYGIEAAKKAQDEFFRVFSRGQLPEDMPVVEVSAEWAAAGAPVVDLLEHAGLVASRSDARRLIQQGAVSIDGEKCVDPRAAVAVSDGAVLRVGRRRFARLSVPE